MLLLSETSLSFAARRPLLAPPHGAAQCHSRRTLAARGCAVPPPDFRSPDEYAAYWEQLLQREYRETADQLRERRAKWSRQRLEASGLIVFGASATPETDLFGEKVVRVSKPGETRLADRFSRGDASPTRCSNPAGRSGST